MPFVTNGVKLSETPLERSRTSAVNRHRLGLGWFLIESFLRQCNYVADVVFSKVDSANQVLAEFVSYAHSCKLRIWRVRYSLLSVQHKYKHLKRKLPRPWEAVQSWQLKLPVQSRLPLDKGVLKVIFISSISLALEHPAWAQYLIPFAALCVLSA